MRRIAPAILALAVLLAGCSRADDPAALVASAKDYMVKGDFNAAVIQLKNALAKDASSAEARYLLGVASLESGDPASAEAELTKAIGLGMRSDELELAFARALLAKGEAARLIAEFGSKTLASDAARADLRALVGLAHLQKGERGHAEIAFGQALTLDATNVKANLGAARLAAARLEMPAAMSRVDAALATSPANFEAHVLKADLLAFQGERQPAEQAYGDAIKLAPRQVAPRLGLITHLLRHRAVEEASAQAADLAKVAPKDPRSAYATALVLIQRRQFAAAREAILPVLKVAPDHAPSLTLAGLAALESGSLAEAESHLRKAVFNAPQAIDAKRLLAATHLRMGQAELALSEVKELVEKAGTEPRILALAGEAYLANGDATSAARYYEKASSLAPAHPSIQTRLAQMHFAAGDAERGIRELEGASARDPEAFQADLALIATHLRQRQADKALGAIDNLEKKQPNNPLTHNLRGLALLLKRDFAGGRASFEQAVQLQPTYMPAVANLARLDVRDKNVDAAKRRYESVLSKEPKNEQALLGLAVLLRIAGADAKEIEALLKKSVAANPASVGARGALVNFYLRGRDAKSALTAAQDAQAAMPNDAAVAQLVGTTQLAAGETQQAISTFRRVAELLPKSPEPRVLLARAHMINKQPDEAIKALRAALTLRPDLQSVQRDIAAIYIATGRLDDALREARAAQSQYPKQPLGHVLEAEIYVVQKQLDLAERKYKETLQRFDLPLLAVRTHAVMDARGRHVEADTLAEAWIKKHPNDTTLLGYLGSRDIAAKRYPAAAKRYRSALERQPDNPELLNNLAWVAHRLKEAKALDYAERAHELAPSNPAVMDTLGWILVESGEVERGVELLGRAAELAPNAPEIRLNFAKALIKADRKDAARKELDTLSKLDSRLPVQQEATKLLSSL